MYFLSMAQMNPSEVIIQKQEANILSVKEKDTMNKIDGGRKIKNL